MSTAHARACLDDAEGELKTADVTAAGEQAVLRAYSLARVALLRLDPREAPELLRRTVGVLLHCASLLEELATSRRPPVLTLVPGGAS